MNNENSGDLSRSSNPADQRENERRDCTHDDKPEQDGGFLDSFCADVEYVMCSLPDLGAGIAEIAGGVADVAVDTVAAIISSFPD